MILSWVDRLPIPFFPTESDSREKKPAKIATVTPAANTVSTSVNTRRNRGDSNGNFDPEGFPNPRHKSFIK
jgi:hypothetical protein